jgi:2-polyprenyl-3-methyl-5-hydroxy-6-metoxy-1,4-benzoquinol methylase
MNRKQRRILAKQGAGLERGGPDAQPSVADLLEEARRQHRQGDNVQAERLCKQILSRVPTHVHSLNLIGIIAQSTGRYQLSLKMLTRAIALDPLNAACHYNIGYSYQVLSRHDEAVAHFKKAIALGLGGKNAEEFIVQSSVIVSYLDRIEKEQLITNESLFGAAGFDSIANELFLRCAMESIVIRTRALEMFLTRLRFGLLRLAAQSVAGQRTVSNAVISCMSALAQQCFLNEYVYIQGEEETRQSIGLRDLLSERLRNTGEVPPLLLAAVGTYFPLYQLPNAEKLLDREWPATVDELVRRQVREPLEELQDRPTIPRLTAIDDGVSMQVMQQYEENPYPRWIIDPHIAAFKEAHEIGDAKQFNGEILVAGCGTGLHVSQVAHQYPEARILAIDISVPSLAYARRKIREAGLHNVEFVQADILKLESIGRSFDRIETVGVLHHLEKPENGWRILLSLLRLGGEMRVGLYSETGRRNIVEARALIAERGYRPTVDDIRKCRQEIFRGDDDGRWKRITSSVDFYSVSGCRDLLFNVMEHRFTIPQISKFLGDHGLSLVNFEAEPHVIQLFQHRFPRAEMTDLKQWHAFELANPMATRFMYVFSVRKDQ